MLISTMLKIYMCTEHMYFLFVYLILFIFTVDQLKILSADIIIMKYDVKRMNSALELLLKNTNGQTEANPEMFEGVETRFPLQTAEQLMEVEEI